VTCDVVDDQVEGAAGAEKSVAEVTGASLAQMLHFEEEAVCVFAISQVPYTFIATVSQIPGVLLLPLLLLLLLLSSSSSSASIFLPLPLSLSLALGPSAR
jgi:hypothetical protein